VLSLVALDGVVVNWDIAHKGRPSPCAARKASVAQDACEAEFADGTYVVEQRNFGLSLMSWNGSFLFARRTRRKTISTEKEEGAAPWTRSIGTRACSPFSKR